MTERGHLTDGGGEKKKQKKTFGALESSGWYWRSAVGIGECRVALERGGWHRRVPGGIGERRVGLESGGWLLRAQLPEK